jgi:hypothetical protein
MQVASPDAAITAAAAAAAVIETAVIETGLGKGLSQGSSAAMAAAAMVSHVILSSDVLWVEIRAAWHRLGSLPGTRACPPLALLMGRVVIAMGLPPMQQAASTTWYS